MNIGFIGVGVMGSAMARHLGEAGHNLALYDIDPAAVARTLAIVPDSRQCSNPREVAAVSEVVFTMLPNGEVVREVVLAEDGLLAGFQTGSILVDTSSAEPWLTQQTAQRLSEKGVDMIDAPVSGAVEGAESATLVCMCGGSESSVARVRPLLDVMGEHVFHLGPTGSGHIMKTINNLATAVNFVAIAEAMLIGKAAGLDSQAMLDVVNVSTSESFVSRRKMGSEVLSRKFEDPFKLEFMLKDMRIANQLAQQLNLGVPISGLGFQLWQQANAALGPGKSVTEIVRWCEQQIGVEL